MKNIADMLNKKYSEELDEPEVEVIDVEEKDEEKFDEEELKKGMEAEREHIPTIDKIREYLDRCGHLPETDEILEWFVGDHLKEYPKGYYDALDEMEEKLDKETPEGD